MTAAAWTDTPTATATATPTNTPTPTVTPTATPTVDPYQQELQKLLKQNGRYPYFPTKYNESWKIYKSEDGTFFIDQRLVNWIISSFRQLNATEIQSREYLSNELKGNSESLIVADCVFPDDEGNPQVIPVIFGGRMKDGRSINIQYAGQRERLSDDQLLAFLNEKAGKQWQLFIADAIVGQEPDPANHPPHDSYYDIFKMILSNVPGQDMLNFAEGVTGHRLPAGEYALFALMVKLNESKFSP